MVVRSAALNTGPLESVYVKFCEMLLGVSKKAPNNACRFELGLFPLRASAKLRAINRGENLEIVTTKQH